MTEKKKKPAKGKAKSEKSAEKSEKSVKAVKEIPALFQNIAITHTALSTKGKIHNGPVQMSMLKAYLRKRGIDIAKVNVEVFEICADKNELGEQIHAFIAANPEGSTYRNGVILPNSRVIESWKKQKVNKVSEPTTK
jgi:hypothetical protein